MKLGCRLISIQFLTAVVFKKNVTECLGVELLLQVFLPWSLLLYFNSIEFELVWACLNYITKECFELALLDWIRLQSCLFWIISLKRSCMKIRMILQKGFLSIALCKKVSCILVKWTMENDLALWIEWGWAYTSWAEAQWGQQFYEFDFKFLFSTTISWFSV